MTHDPRFARDGSRVEDARPFIAKNATNKKWLPTIDPEILALERSHPVKIYNVSRKTWRIQTGLGEYTVQACPEGKAHSDPIVLAAVIHEPIPVDMDKMEFRPSGGKKLALDIVGLGTGISPNRNLLRFGVFIASDDTFDGKNYQDWLDKGKCGEEPTPKELERANKAVIDEAKRLVAEADNKALQGPAGYAEIGAHHRESLAFLRSKNLDVKERSWMTVSQQMDTCPGCQQPVAPGAARHACGAVLDYKKARELRMISSAEYEEAVADGLVPGVKPKKETAKSA